MDVLTYIMAGFSVLGALDYLTGSHFKIGKEFERAIMLSGTIFLSMLGMLVLVPAIDWALSPALTFIAQYVPIDPSVFAGSLLANDMGGTHLAEKLALNPLAGQFNGLVVGATLGATISYTLPFVMSVIKKEQQKNVLLGLMCGIVAIPVGCIVAGLMMKMEFISLVQNVVPIIIFSGIIAFGLVKFPRVSLKIFHVFGILIKGLIVIGLSIGILELLLGDFIPLTEPADEGVMVCFRAVCFLSGAFPLVSILQRLLKKPFAFISKKTGLNEVSTFGFVTSLATNVTTFSNMKDMDDKGVVFNSAFAVSASWTFAGHLAWTISVNPSLVPAVIVAKLVSGVTGLLVAVFIYRLIQKNERKKACEQSAPAQNA